MGFGSIFGGSKQSKSTSTTHNNQRQNTVAAEDESIVANEGSMLIIRQSDEGAIQQAFAGINENQEIVGETIEDSLDLAEKAIDYNLFAFEESNKTLGKFIEKDAELVRDGWDFARDVTDDTVEVIELQAAENRDALAHSYDVATTKISQAHLTAKGDFDWLTAGKWAGGLGVVALGIFAIAKAGG